MKTVVVFTELLNANCFLAIKIDVFCCFLSVYTCHATFQFVIERFLKIFFMNFFSFFSSLCKS